MMAPLETPREVPLSAKIVRSVTVGALRYVFLAPIPFVMTPLILRKIGITGYGTWAIFLAINGMTSLTDLGLAGTLSKFVAQYYAARDLVALSRLLNSALALFLLLGLATGGIIAAATRVLIGLLFRGSSVAQGELVFLLRCFVVVVVANILILLLSSVTSGLQRLDLTYIMSAANILLGAGTGGFFLLRGWGLPGLVYAYVGSALLIVIGYIFIIRKLLPEVPLNPLRVHLGEARKMLGFSLRLYVIQAAVGIQNQVDKVLLSLLIGVAPVGWFEIASDVALKIRAVIGLILGPVLPAASELNALGDERRTKELYYRAHKYLALFGIPVVVGVIAFSRRFVELWLGPSMAIIAAPMSLLVTVYFFNLASGPGFLIFAGRGYLKPAIQSSALGIVLNVVLSFVLIYKFGFAGAAFGTSASLLMAAVFLIWVFHFETGYPFGRLLRESYLKPTLCSIFVMGTLLATRPTRTVSWFGLVAMGLAFATLYSIVILFSHFFDEYDWSKIESLVPAARYARRNAWIA